MEDQRAALELCEKPAQRVRRRARAVGSRKRQHRFGPLVGRAAAAGKACGRAGGGVGRLPRFPRRALLAQSGDARGGFSGRGRRDLRGALPGKRRRCATSGAGSRSPSPEFRAASRTATSGPETCSSKTGGSREWSIGLRAGPAASRCSTSCTCGATGARTHRRLAPIVIRVALPQGRRAVTSWIASTAGASVSSSSPAISSTSSARTGSRSSGML